MLTPLLNSGLPQPQQVLDAARAARHAVPLNSLDGFVRQLVG